jgi:hypothetical protein
MDQRERLLRAVLLYFQGGAWNDKQQAKYDELIGSKTSASSAGLCDAIRKHLEETTKPPS